MKRMFGLLFLFLIVGVGSTLAQSGELSVQNPQVSGNQVSFDVYLRSTTTSTLYLTETSLYFIFDGSKFTNPTSSFTSSLPVAYSLDATIYNTTPKRLSIDIGFPQSPTTTNTQIVSAIGNGTKLGTVTLTGITDFTGDLGLQWGTTLPYATSSFYWDPNPNQEYPISLNFATAPVVSLAPAFDAIVANQQLVNNEYTYDLYLRRTGGSSFYIDDLDVILTFNNAAFGGSAVYSLVSAGTPKLSTYYTFQSFVISGNELRFSLAGPAITSQLEFNERVQEIAGSGDSTYIGRFKVSNPLVTTTVTDVSPLWKTSGTAPVTLVYNRRSVAPWNSDDVTGNGTYIVNAPVFNVTLTAPNGGELICPGANTNITWNSSNIASVRLELLQGGAVVSSIATVSAGTGTYAWAVPSNVTAGNNYRIRITDAGNSAYTDESDADFSVGSAPLITMQPASATFISGSTATLTVAATGSNVTYQWQVLSAGNFADVPGANAAMLSIPNAQVSNSGDYRVVVSGSCAPAAISDTVTLTILPQGVTVVVKAFMQGYWNGTTHVPTPVAVELRSGATLMGSALVGRTTGMLGTDGTISADFAGVISGNYWIVVRHGGYLPIGSASAVAMTSGTTVNYDFTDLASKAAGSSTVGVVVGGTTYYMLKSGDLNGDRAANPVDVPIFLDGYSKTNALSVPAVD